MENKTADELILRIADADMTALETLYNGLARKVYAFSMSIVKNPSVAEDVMQDTFVRVYRAAVSFKPTGFGCAWIMRIARNLSLNAVSGLRNDSDEVSEDKPDICSTEDSAVASVMLNRALDRLTATERQVVTLHSMAGMKLNEIASVLDMPVGTIKWHHSRALKKLRDDLSGEEASECRMNGSIS